MWVDFEELYRAGVLRRCGRHPSEDRYLRGIFEPYARFLFESSTSLMIIDSYSDKIIGCSRYYVSPDRPESISIGFTFLHHPYWGGVTNFELKRVMLDYAFEYFSEVWFHIAPTNIRSQKATMKVGATYVCEAVLDLSGNPQHGCVSVSIDRHGDAS